MIDSVIKCPLCEWSARNEVTDNAAATARINYFLRVAFVEHVARVHGVPDCTCRNSACGHPASMHVGDGGACIMPKCRCGVGGWQ